MSMHKGYTYSGSISYAKHVLGYRKFVNLLNSGAVPLIPMLRDDEGNSAHACARHIVDRKLDYL
ncbi:hypothetical protein P029_01700 [Anaplasma phagocytophilum str. Norway variant2]|uniref:Uncharacterized protein n=2 Tax=Anaplasma phagocytophilum TaxID=948 RepID=A0A161I5L8_ANAPH|nr:hypothetical protein P029_01700 [Anaplasma phagocytophilum str. Norway variant2]